MHYEASKMRKETDKKANYYYGYHKKINQAKELSKSVEK